MLLSQKYTLVTTRCCDFTFAITENTFENWRRTRRGWKCPSCGEGWCFTGKSEEQKQREKAERELARAQARAIRAESAAKDSNRKYRRMRTRIRNGVCPGCNRTFDNVARHMATKHPNFGKDRQLAHLRSSYGLTQADLEGETGVNTAYISAFENGRRIPGWATDSLETWRASQASA